MTTGDSAGPKKIYWDACVFLSLIEADADRIDMIESVLDEMEKGKVQIFTSMISIAEVAFAKQEKDGKKLSKVVEQKIDGLWKNGSPFLLVDVYRTVVNDARSLVREALQQSLPLKPPDAIHFATAKRLGASQFHTYDEFRNKTAELSQLLAVPIGPPDVSGKFIWPSVKKKSKS